MGEVTSDAATTVAGLSGKCTRGADPGAREGECMGEICPEPAVLPASISNALKAREVEREREQPRKT